MCLFQGQSCLDFQLLFFLLAWYRFCILQQIFSFLLLITYYYREHVRGKDCGLKREMLKHLDTDRAGQTKRVIVRLPSFGTKLAELEIRQVTMELVF